MPFTTVVAVLLAAAPVQGQNEQLAGELLGGYCMDCHNFNDFSGGLALDLLSLDEVPQDAEIWEAAVRKLRGRLMPPPGNPQPEQENIDALVGWLEDLLDHSAIAPRAGHVPVQRLNRTEYALAVKDLLAVDMDPEEHLPAELEVDGFENIAAALSVSPSFLDQHIGAARAAARLAVGVPKLSNAFYPSPGGAQGKFSDGMPLGTRGGMKFVHNFPADGEYIFNLLDLDAGLYLHSLETEQTVVILVNRHEIFRGAIGGPEDLALINKGGAPGRAQLMQRFSNIPAQIRAGAHEVVVTYIERARAESDWNVDASNAGSSNFSGNDGLRLSRVLEGVEIVGPYNPTGISPTPSREKIFVCEPKTVDEERGCAERITANLAQRAFRRPLTREDLDFLMPFYDEGRRGGSFDTGIEQMIAAVLTSPDFLYRGVSPMKDAREGELIALSELELATRLSFFLWGQGPDEELLALAETGELADPQVMASQVRRLLKDERALSLVNNFALRWLNLDGLDEVEPDPALFPGFNDRLREDFAREVRLFIASILLEDRPVRELLDGGHTYLNDRLAAHYGIEAVYGDQFRRVELDDEARWGLLGKAAVLLRTSYGDRTSPVLRGAWVLEKLMGTPPAPPPPNVETDLSVAEGEQHTTLRARLEAHRDDQGCNQCHGVIDPMGLPLEKFDAIGRWREFDFQAQEAIDASTVLPSGAALDGPIALREELLRHPDQFAQALTEKLMMYGLGRELEYFDMPQVRAIVRAAAERDYRLSAIVEGIVNSDAFRLQAPPHGGGSEISQDLGLAGLAGMMDQPLANSGSEARQSIGLAVNPAEPRGDAN